MASFTQGEIITASKLNEVNNVTISTVQPNDGGNHGMKERNGYCYVTAPAGSGRFYVYAQGGWNWFTTDEAYVYLYRYENGSWVQKAYDEDQGGNVSHNRVASIQGTLLGPGSYRGRGRVRYCHTINIQFVNAKTNIQQGEILKALSNSMGISTSGLVSLSSDYGTSITVDKLNNRQVYT